MNAARLMPTHLPPRLGAAVLVSVCAHGVLLTLALQHRGPEFAALVGQRRGALNVVTLEVPRRQPVKVATVSATATVPATAVVAVHEALKPAHRQPPVSIPLTAPLTPPLAPHPKQAPEFASPRPEAAQPAVDMATSAKGTTPSSAAQASSATPPAAPAAKPPGSQFASLFAPIIQSPMGQGRWVSGGRQSPQMPVSDPEQARMQAVLALKSSMQDRLESLAASLRAGGHAARCDLVVDTARRIASLQCEREDSVQQMWSYLQGVLVPGATPTTTSLLCLHFSEQQLVWQACQAPGSAEIAAP